MRNEFLHAHQRLSEAIFILATHPGDVRARLGQVFLAIHMILEDEIPVSCRNDWAWTMEQLVRFGPVYDKNRGGAVLIGTIENTMRRIKNSTGVKIAERFFKLQEDVEKYYSSPRSEEFGRHELG